MIYSYGISQITSIVVIGPELMGIIIVTSNFAKICGQRIDQERSAVWRFIAGDCGGVRGEYSVITSETSSIIHIHVEGTLALTFAVRNL